MVGLFVFLTKLFLCAVHNAFVIFVERTMWSSQFVLPRKLQISTTKFELTGLIHNHPGEVKLVSSEFRLFGLSYGLPYTKQY